MAFQVKSHRGAKKVTIVIKDDGVIVRLGTETPYAYPVRGVAIK